MENIGDGENGKRTDAPSTADLSQPSRKSGKQPTKQTKQPITPEEATALLTSALKYCQEAGLIVSGYNEGPSLILSIDGVQYVGEKIQVTPASVTISVTDGVTV